MMTNRERILAIMDGKSPDRIPWVPRMERWWMAQRNMGTLPEKYKSWRLRDIEHDLGMGTPARDGLVYSSRFKNVEKVVRYDGLDIYTEYVTPVGTVGWREKRTPELDMAGIRALEVEKPIKRPEDYDVMMYIVENTQYYPRYEEYMAYEEEIGEDGYPLVNAGDCPFHHFLESYVGYEKGYLDLVDYTQKVERLLELMAQKEREEMWPLVAKSPAKLILHGSHFDSQMTPPHFFERYITPYYQEFSKLLHQNGKTLAIHADNDSRHILHQMKDAGFDMMDCFTTAPLVPCTMQEAREAWGTSVIIWGGVPSILLEESVTDEEFEQYLVELFQTIAPGDAFILGVADNVMPTSMLSRVIRIGEFVEEHGHYPVKV